MSFLIKNILLPLLAILILKASLASAQPSLSQDKDAKLEFFLSKRSAVVIRIIDKKLLVDVSPQFQEHYEQIQTVCQFRTRCLLKKLKELFSIQFENKAISTVPQFFVSANEQETVDRIKAYLRAKYNPIENRALELNPFTHLAQRSAIAVLLGAATPQQKKMLDEAAEKIKQTIEQRGYTPLIIPLASVMDLASTLSSRKIKAVIWLSHGGVDKSTKRGLFLDSNKHFVPREVFNLSALEKDGFFYAFTCYAQEILHNAFSKDSTQVYGTPGNQMANRSNLNSFVVKAQETIHRLPLLPSTPPEVETKELQAFVQVKFTGLITPGQYFVYLNNKLVGELSPSNSADVIAQKFLFPLGWLGSKPVIKIMPVFLDQGIGLKYDAIDDFEILGVEIFSPQNVSLFARLETHYIGNNESAPDLLYYRGTADALDMDFNIQSRRKIAVFIKVKTD